MSQIPQGPGGAAGAGGLLGNMLGQRQQGPTVGGVSPGGVLLAGALNQGHGPQGQLVGQGRPQAPQIP